MTLSPLIASNNSPRFSRDRQAFVHTVKPNASDLIQVELGDTKSVGLFQPQIKLLRWQNRANTSFRLMQSETGAPSLNEINGLVTWRRGSVGVNLFAYAPGDGMEDGGHELTSLFWTRPANDQVQYSVLLKNCQLFKQLPLSSADIAAGASRDPMYDNSFAVYSSFSGDYSPGGGQNFKVGKMKHILPSTFSDSSVLDSNGFPVGRKVLGTDTWDAASGVFTSQPPAGWLDQATYPIAHGPTFGYTSIGATGVEWDNFITACKFTNGASGITVTGMSVAGYTDLGNGGTAAAGDTAIYSDSSGVPGALVGADNGTSFTTNTGSTPTWCNTTFGGLALSASTVYWLASWVNVTGGFGSNWVIMADTGSTNQLAAKNTGTFNTWPTTYGTPGFQQTWQASIYATYGSSGSTTSYQTNRLANIT